MVATFKDDFSLTWTDDRDAESHWSLSTNRPMAPLTQALDSVVMAAVFGSRSVYVNGYAFRTGFSWTLPRVAADLAERSRSPQIWQTYYLPAAKDISERIRHRDYDAMPAGEGADALEAAFHEAAIGFRYTMLLRHLAENELGEFCKEELGSDQPELVATLLQGHPNPSADTGTQLERLADFARTNPELAAALRHGRYEQLNTLPGGEEFTSRLRAFLDEYGWRAEAWELVHVPTWAEDPSMALSLVTRYLEEDKEHLPSIAIRRAVSQRMEAQEQVEGRLDASKLDRFRELLSACDGWVFMSESRYHWIVTLLGSVRLPALGIGRKLMNSGVIEGPNDIFFLTMPEAKELLDTPVQMLAVVAGRKADLERWQTLSPPPYVGSPPGPNDMPPRTSSGDRPRIDSLEERVVTGQGASRGTSRAKARVVLNLRDSHRRQPGEILVSRWTAAPWTPLFAIAGGVVTDAGGILDHAATCAREYGIPCVVATHDATSRIPDGATVTIDGGQGR